MKSPPELWAEVSDAGALAGHLGAFGEIRITRLEPESTVAWEGDRARGTVELEPSGWGTKVTLTARIDDAPKPESAAAPEPELAPVPEPEPEPEPAAAPDPPAPAAPARRRGLLARLFGRRRPPQPTPAPRTLPQVDAAAEAPAPSAPALAPARNEPAPLDAGRAEEILAGVLDDLGAAHHRPFSRG